MARPFLSCQNVGETETIALRFCWQTPLLAIYFAGCLQELGLPALVRVIGEVSLVELTIRRRHLNHVNFGFYLMEGWTRA